MLNVMRTGETPTYYPHLHAWIREEQLPIEDYYEERISLRREK
jgi:hypothetical protein